MGLQCTFPEGEHGCVVDGITDMFHIPSTLLEGQRCRASLMKTGDKYYVSVDAWAAFMLRSLLRHIFIKLTYLNEI